MKTGGILPRLLAENERLKKENRDLRLQILQLENVIDTYYGYGNGDSGGSRVPPRSGIEDD